MIPTEVVEKQEELRDILKKDPHFVDIEPQQVGKEWYLAVSHDEEKVRPATYFKGTPVVFKKLSKRFIP
jgi:hypothetical protein